MCNFWGYFSPGIFAVSAWKKSDFFVGSHLLPPTLGPNPKGCFSQLLGTQRQVAVLYLVITNKNFPYINSCFWIFLVGSVICFLTQLAVYTTYIPTYVGSPETAIDYIWFHFHSFPSMHGWSSKFQTKTHPKPKQPNPNQTQPTMDLKMYLPLSSLVNQLTPSTPTHPSNPFHPHNPKSKRNGGKTPWDGFSPSLWKTPMLEPFINTQVI